MCFKKISALDLVASGHMWAHETQGEGTAGPAQGMSLGLRRAAGTEGGVWGPSEVLLEAPVCLRQEAWEYPVC